MTLVPVVVVLPEADVDFLLSRFPSAPDLWPAIKVMADERGWTSEMLVLGRCLSHVADSERERVHGEQG